MAFDDLLKDGKPKFYEDPRLAEEEERLRQEAERKRLAEEARKAFEAEEKRKAEEKKAEANQIVSQITNILGDKI